MENHPIPQDVTGFQFKLIGDMTLKQFAYLATGCILAWISFSSPALLVIRISLSAIFFLAGAGIAFLPLAGRPLDVMIVYFFRALFAPNQYMYEKIGRQILVPLPHVKIHHKKVAMQESESSDKLRMFINSLPAVPQNELDKKETNFFNSLSDSFKGIPQPNSTPEVSQEVANTPKEAGLTPEEQLEEEEKKIEAELAAAKAKETDNKNPEEAQLAHERVGKLEEQLSTVMLEKAKLEEQLANLTKVALKEKPLPQDAIPQQSHIRQIPKEMAVSIGIPITSEYPNVVSGIVKDSRGNILPNILVEIVDADGNPARAFKTNKLGLFASATPLREGTYMITFEDPQGKQQFEKVQITVSGQVLLPLEVISTDDRELLRRDLFNKTV
jgi:hypothetical protein